MTDIEDAIELWDALSTRIESAGDDEIDRVGAAHALSMMLPQQRAHLSDLPLTDVQRARVSAAADRLEHALRARLEN